VAYSLEFVVGTIYLESAVDVVAVDAEMEALEVPVPETFHHLHSYGSFFHHSHLTETFFDHCRHAFFVGAVAEGLFLKDVYSLLNS